MSIHNRRSRNSTIMFSKANCWACNAPCNFHVRDPFAGGKRGRLVHSKAERRFIESDAELIAPCGKACIGIAAPRGIRAVLCLVLIAPIEDQTS